MSDSPRRHLISRKSLRADSEKPDSGILIEDERPKPPEDIPSFSDLIDMLHADPEKAVGEARRFDQSIEARRNEHIAIGYGYALKVKDGTIAVAELYDRDLFKIGYKKNKRNLLLHCLCLVANSCQGPSYKRAGEQARALQAVFDQKNPISAEEIPAYIKRNGGIDGLLKARKGPSRMAKANSLSDTRVADELRSEQAQPTSTETKPNSDNRSREYGKLCKLAKKLGYLLIKAEVGVAEAVCAINLDTEHSLIITRGSDSSDWAEIKARRLQD